MLSRNETWRQLNPSSDKPKRSLSTTRRDDGLRQIPIQSDRTSLGTDVQHRVSDCLTGKTRDHRYQAALGIPMLGFGATGVLLKDAAKRLTKCAAISVL